MNKNIEKLIDISGLDKHGFMLMDSTGMYDGLFWTLVRKIFLNQEKRISDLEKQIKKLKKDEN